ncbi:AraC family transcriptional regulator [Pseudopedobacter beijingensis]|uniref:AraC family transcriptional regulator n=1 Tax=Pseudopedobacter beijingensis TaxID=1207056 RepID=A0ABW4IJ00_9SPHI
MKKKRKGFSGERIIDLLKNSFAKDKRELGMPLSFSKIGFFPDAKFQYNDENNDEDYILIYCVDGRGYSEINNKVYDLGAGEFVIIPKGLNTKYYADGDNPWSFYWFYFKDNDEIIKQILAFFYKFNKNYKGFLEYGTERMALFNTVFDRLNKGYSDDNLIMLNICLMNFLTSLSFIITEGETSFHKGQGRISQSIEKMNKHLETSISLETLAKDINLSVSQFSLLFKNRTGVSPIDYFNQLKIQNACKYLDNTSMQIKEIAYKIGIHDAAYFSRLFKKIKGVSPADYRKRLPYT